MDKQRADYGIDAPGVIRNLFIAGVTGVSVWLVLVALTQRGSVRLHPGLRAFSGMSFGMGIGCTFGGLWMLWEAKVGKMRDRDQILQRISWVGNEQVLDVGCGRGLLLIGAAKRLTTGHATGIDLWQAEDLSGNNPEATLENARREEVADRIDVRTADMRQMPFEDSTFDVIVSRAAVHNIYTKDGRETAIREIARVLKPGGRAIIDDIRHQGEYSRAFVEQGCSVHQAGSWISRVFFMLVTFGSLSPGILVVEKIRKTAWIPARFH